MEFVDDRNCIHNSNNNHNSAPNNGVTNFLRHFSSHRTHSKDASSSSSLSQLKKSSRLLRTIGRSSTNKHHAKIATHYEDSTTSPSSVLGSTSTTTAFHRVKGKYFTHREEEDIITFESDTTRLGIRPTCYDVVPVGTYNDGVANGTNNLIDEEVYFLNNNVAAAASITPLSLTSVPSLFANLPIWEETRQDELQDSTHRPRHNGLTSSSPQKSIGSCDSIKSDGSAEDEEEYCNFLFASSGNPSKGRGNTNRNRSSSNCSVSSNVSMNLMQKAKSIVQRSRDKENHSCDSSQVSASSSILSMSKASRKSRNGANTNTHVDTVKIFLLLVEPKSKVFELIQLLYPRNKTKVIDLLKMIPKNATEQALATQPYVGITRPKRRSDPIMDLHVLASNSVFNITGNPTAAIESGEIIVAIPSMSSTKEIVVLAKQILASSHIQKLISISKGHPSGGSAMDANGRNKVVKKRKSDKSKGNICKKIVNHPTSESTHINYTATPFNPIQPPEESRSPKIVSFVDDNCTEELKRAIDNANLANEEAGCSPSVTPTSFLSESVPTIDPINRANAVEFPRDMLDAYMSKDAIMKMCSTPNHNSKIPSIECTSSSSMVDDTEENDVDASSCDGSMTSSFHSWALSLDSTSIPSLNKGNGCALRGIAGASTSHLHGGKKKRFLTRKVKRVAMTALVSSIARYHMDPNGLYSTQALRSMALFEPMGLIGFIYFVLTFSMLMKLQMYYTRHTSSDQPPPAKRCPVVRSISKWCKRVQRSMADVNPSPKLDDDHQYQQSLVPTSIHAIKLG